MGLVVKMISMSLFCDKKKLEKRFPLLYYKNKAYKVISEK
jgi:hypothetical protein